MAARHELVVITQEGPVAFLSFNRPEKRNAINDETLEIIQAFFANPPAGVKAVVLSGEGGNFSAGLDLSEAVRRAPHEVMRHSRNWHSIMELIQFGGLPVVAALTGAVMGGGLEIAAACHIRVADPEVKFRLPEGQRGIFVGGGGSVRIGQMIGPDRLTDMLLTGRVYSGSEGQAIGLAHYVSEAGQALAQATEIATQIAKNSSLVNYLVIQSVARFANMSSSDGLYAESLAAALSQSGPDAEEGLKAFLEKRKPSFS